MQCDPKTFFQPGYWHVGQNWCAAKRQCILYKSVYPAAKYRCRNLRIYVGKKGGTYRLKAILKMALLNITEMMDAMIFVPEYFSNLKNLPLL